MKRNLIIVLIFNLVTLSSCNNNPSGSPGKESVSQNGLSGKVVNPSLLCYAFTNQKDTVLLKMKIDKNQVSGDLIYDYFEKDRSTGSIQGEMKGDTLFATYTFRSEGKESKREVVFLKKRDELIEGYADSNPSTGEPDFSDHSSIKFDEKFALRKVDCH